MSHALRELLDVIDARHRLTTTSPQTSTSTRKSVECPSRTLYDVCRGRKDDVPGGIGTAGRIRSFSRQQRPTRQWERRASSAGTVGPGSKLSFMTTRDFSRSIAERDGDASQKNIRLIRGSKGRRFEYPPYRLAPKSYTSRWLRAIHRRWLIPTSKGRRRRGCSPVLASTTHPRLLVGTKA